MPVKRFPPPETADETGLLAIGGDLEPESLLLAYGQGIFPWPVGVPNDYGDEDGKKYPLTWFCPPQRAILEFKDLHIPRSLQKVRRQNRFTFTLDRAFASVIHHCAQTPRGSGQGGPGGTWITPEIEEAYLKFHLLGHAHSVEAWLEGKLVGGVYGVSVSGNFAGESMFHLEANASKLALLFLIESLQKRGLDWIDIQMLTPHLEALGAKEISRDDFLRKLSQTRAKSLRLFE